MLAAGAMGGALPLRLGAADRAPGPGTMDYAATPWRFDQPLHVPGADGLQGYLRVAPGVLRVEAVTRATSPGLALTARNAERDYLDPTLVIHHNLEHEDGGMMLRVKVG